MKRVEVREVPWRLLLQQLAFLVHGFCWFMISVGRPVGYLLTAIFQGSEQISMKRVEVCDLLWRLLLQQLAFLCHDDS